MASGMPPTEGSFGPAPVATSADLDHLRLLYIFHYVYGGIACLCSGFPLIYVAVGIALATSSPDEQAKVVGPIMAVIGGVASFMGLVVSLLTLYSGWCLSKYRNRVFSIVIAAIHCMNFPIGTALGVCTILVLVRPTVQALYAENEARRF